MADREYWVNYYEKADGEVYRGNIEFSSEAAAVECGKQCGGYPASYLHTEHVWEPSDAE